MENEKTRTAKVAARACFAVLKLSYNEAGAASPAGGVCGTGFFIGPNTAISALHVLNQGTFTPNPGYRRCQVWVVTRRGRIYPLEHRQITLHAEFDTTVIRLDTGEPWPGLWPCAITASTLEGRNVWGLGHIGDAMPKLDAEWRGDSLQIKTADISPVVCDRRGLILKGCTLSVRANDVNLTNVQGFELSFGSRVGMSGGPVVDDDSGEVVGMLSLGLPPDAPVRTRTFGISMEEITGRLHRGTK
jgi:Trypsin-like peptidase domain